MSVPEIHRRAAGLRRPLALALVLLAGLGLQVIATAQDRAPEEAVRRVCRLCHAPYFEGLASSPHQAIESLGDENGGGRLACTACHGDVSTHIGAGGGRGNVFAFKTEPPAEQSARCLACHADDHPQFERSQHAQAGLACSSCHRQHSVGGSAASPNGNRPAVLLRSVALPAAQAGAGARSAICFECHGEIFAQFSATEHHRLHEGVLECVSCHDPHASASRRLLGGFKQEQCGTCHADKTGPFVFEHGAVRAEGCTACHVPHGSPNRHLLAHQQVAELCYSCHAAVPQFHLGFAPVGAPRFGLDTQCANCHSAIHGSNLDAFFLR